MLLVANPFQRWHRNISMQQILECNPCTCYICSTWFVTRLHVCTLGSGGIGEMDGDSMLGNGDEQST